jgi:DnaK suppressor protein
MTTAENSRDGTFIALYVAVVTHVSWWNLRYFELGCFMTDLKKLKSHLETKLAELLERVDGIEDTLRDPGEKDWEENAIAWEKNEALEAIEVASETEIREIRRALQRIESGEYGKCSECNQPIAKARLEAVPWATTCMECA